MVANLLLQNGGWKHSGERLRGQKRWEASPGHIYKDLPKGLRAVTSKQGMGVWGGDCGDFEASVKNWNGGGCYGSKCSGGKIGGTLIWSFSGRFKRGGCTGASFCICGWASKVSPHHLYKDFPKAQRPQSGGNGGKIEGRKTSKQGEGRGDSKKRGGFEGWVGGWKGGLYGGEFLYMWLGRAKRAWRVKAGGYLRRKIPGTVGGGKGASGGGELVHN